MTAGNPLGILLVEDHEMVRQMLASMLTACDGMQVVGSVGSISEARTAVNEAAPNLVVLDVAMPDGSGIDWAKELKKAHPETKVVFLTAYNSEETVLGAIGSGAEGYVVKSGSCDRLIEVIRSVGAGEQAFDLSIITPILRRIAAEQASVGRNGGSNGVSVLSAREREIARLASNGLTNQEIAEKTSLSINTVRTHLRKVFLNLGISSRRELSRRAF